MINPQSKLLGFVRPTFINPDNQKAYDSSSAINASTMQNQPTVAATSAQGLDDVAKKVSSDAITISPLLSKFQGTYRPTQQAAPRPNQNSNSTPQTYPSGGKLSLDLNKLGTTTTPWGGGTKFENFHPGIDIANKIGTPIPSFSGGTITSVTTGKKQGDNGYGNSVIVTDAQGNKLRYSHLHNVYVKVGQKIAPGQEMATMGNSGSTYSTSGGTGSHLDFRIVDAANRYMNPSSYFKTT